MEKLARGGDPIFGLISVESVDQLLEGLPYLWVFVGELGRGAENRLQTGIVGKSGGRGARGRRRTDIDAWAEQKRKIEMIRIFLAGLLGDLDWGGLEAPERFFYVLAKGSLARAFSEVQQR